MLIIKFNINTDDKPCYRYAQNRSATFDNAFTVVNLSEALRFDTTEAAHKWLVKHGFMRRSRSKWSSGYTGKGVTMPAPFTGWEIISEEWEKAGQDHHPTHGFVVGDSVVFNRLDGSSQSAKVTRVEKREVQITYRSAPNCLNNVWVQESGFNRLTKFAPGCSFMVTK